MQLPLPTCQQKVHDSPQSPTRFSWYKYYTIKTIKSTYKNSPCTCTYRLNRLEETGISKSTTAIAMKLLKLLLYKETVVHALQPCYPASRVNFCNWFLQSVHDGEVDPRLTLFLMKHGSICRDTHPPKIIGTGILLIQVTFPWLKSWCVLHSEC
jgi:hypothetical protein